MSESELVKNDEFMFQIYNAEFNRLRSHFVTSNNNLNLKSQNATIERWESLRSQNVTIESRHRQHRKHLPYAFTLKQWIEKSQQAVAQLVQIPWGQNITKNLPDEFKSSLPSIEDIEAELSRREDA